jgi:hypothetical protein
MRFAAKTAAVGFFSAPAAGAADDFQIPAAGCTKLSPLPSVPIPRSSSMVLSRL